jgi:signal transduction histidine kinase
MTPLDLQFRERAVGPYAPRVTSTSLDLLEELRATLDELAPLLSDRIVDIEMPRVRVLTDAEQFRPEFTALIESAVRETAPTESITVRVARRGTSVRIEVVSERAGEHSHLVVGSMSVPLDAGTASAADA